MIVLFGGPAGAGKTTLARAWCATRLRAAHIGLDEVRALIVAGLADPQVQGSLQADQFRLSAEATCAMARVFADAGYDVAVDDVFDPEPFEHTWRPSLGDVDWQLIILRPALDETLARSRARTKSVRAAHTRTQHASSGTWSADVVIDTSHLTISESLDLLERRLGTEGSR